MLSLAKRLVFGSGPGPQQVRFGPARGCWFMLDPAVQTQRLLGLAEAEIAFEFRRLVSYGQLTLLDIGASDGHYCYAATRLNRHAVAIGYEPNKLLNDLASHEHHRMNTSLHRGSPPVLFWSVPVGTGPDCRSLDAAAFGRETEPLVLKIDVDGAELDVLRSGSFTLRRPDVSVILEVHSQELEEACIALLREHRFHVRVISRAWWRRFIPETRPTPWNRWVVATKGALAWQQHTKEEA